eukprot:3933340-Prymnesium_polylepis.1
MILGLAYIFIKTSAGLRAFRRLVPHVFSTHLLLGTDARAALNRTLGFDEQARDHPHMARGHPHMA